MNFFAFEFFLREGGGDFFAFGRWVLLCIWAVGTNLHVDGGDFFESGRLVRFFAFGRRVLFLLLGRWGFFCIWAVGTFWHLALLCLGGGDFFAFGSFVFGRWGLFCIWAVKGLRHHDHAAGLFLHSGG
jgi:hypothetical protein